MTLSQSPTSPPVDGVSQKPTHTPGPWVVNWAGAGKNGQLVYDEVYVYAPSCGIDDISVAADIVDPLTGKPSIANARLIAAAPDLLAALRALVDSHAVPSSICAERPAYEAARAAIQRATGEQS